MSSEEVSGAKETTATTVRARKSVCMGEAEKRHLFEAGDGDGGDVEATAREDLGLVLGTLLGLLEGFEDLLGAEGSLLAREVEKKIEVGQLGTASELA